MKFSLNTSTASALHLNRNVSAPRERVYKAFTEGPELQRWWIPEGAQGATVKADVKVNGTASLAFQDAQGQKHSQTVTYRAVTKNEMLVFSLGPDSAAKKEPETLVTVEFRKAEKGTQLSVTHEGLPDAAAQERHRQEWVQRLDRLAKLVAG